MLLVGLGLTYVAVFGNFVDTNNSSKKEIYYDNFDYTENVIFYGSDGLDIQYSGELSIPGDYYELTFDVINESNVDVEIADCFYQETDDFIAYNLLYANGEKISIGDTLKKGESKRLKYKVVYKKSIESDEYEFDSSFRIHFEQII